MRIFSPCVCLCAVPQKCQLLFGVQFAGVEGCQLDEQEAAV